MNITHTMRSGLALAMSLLLSGAQTARAAEIFADLGGRGVTVTGSREKFNEYRDLRQGAFVDDFSLGLGGDAYFLDLSAQNGGLRDERYSVEGGRYGKFKASASYDRMPHNFSRGRSILSGMGTDSQGLSSAVQSVLQASEQTRGERGGAPTADTTGEDAGQQAFIRDLIGTTDA